MLNNLFKPIKIGNLELKNRIALSPMGIGSYNEDETITEDYVDFIKVRSCETGLIITTGTRVTEKYGKFKINGCFDEKFIPSLSKLTKTARKNGTKILLQILAFGPADPFEPFVPSLNIPEYANIEEMEARPKELTTGQIEELSSEFINAAKIARESGFDGVELFGSEDGLISAFICPHFNKRTDKFGGSFENRMRFPVEILKGIRMACGKDFAVGFKFNAIYNIDEGVDVDLGIKIAERMFNEGAAYIHCWSFETFERPMPTYKYTPMPNLYQPRNTLADISGKIKKYLPEIPVITVGGILKPDEADEIIARGNADIVAVGRAFIADNLWSYKAKFSESIRPCIRCLVCHNEVALKGNLITCSVNPDIFSKDNIARVKKPREITVIGGGPAGITAAVTAAKRGHRVTLFEKEEKIGGKLIPGSEPAFKHEFKDFLDYLKNDLYKSDTEVFTDTKITVEMIANRMPDAVILALGAIPVYPEISGIDSTNVFDAVYALNNPEKFIGGDIAVIGGGDVGCETALFLKRKGSRKVAIIEILDELMKEEIKYNSVILEKMLVSESIDIYLESMVMEIKENCLSFVRKNGIAESIKTDFIIVAAGFKVPDQELVKYGQLNLEMYVIGD
ncbi:MAG: NAD(P)/FAD-dependent oxidoreductase, partial [Actinobacteria bacterium]|nr:NAD(P)/FAD-dependent oxidoreductase [Actinomycetota bacterium]